MRDIKFRAWDPDDKEMYEPMVLAVVDNASLSLSPLRNCKDGNKAYKPHHPLMQFTGLKDMHDRDIYEGDLLKAFGGFIYQVVFSDGAFYMKLRAVNHRLSTFFIKNEEIRIVGNIHENPELIK